MWAKRKMEANPKASLPERKQKASVTCRMKTSPVERDSFVVNDFNCW